MTSDLGTTHRVRRSPPAIEEVQRGGGGRRRYGGVMEPEEIPLEYRGWWRIVETSQWESKYLDLVVRRCSL